MVLVSIFDGLFAANDTTLLNITTVDDNPTTVSETL